jgi:hypothetical protein
MSRKEAALRERTPFLWRGRQVEDRLGRKAKTELLFVMIRKKAFKIDACDRIIHNQNRNPSRRNSRRSAAQGAIAVSRPSRQNHRAPSRHLPLKAEAFLNPNRPGGPILQRRDEAKHSEVRILPTAQ